MIAKYQSACRYCKKPITVGRDEYDIESKTSYHAECHENPKPTPECYAIADRLGFIESDIVDRDSFSEVHADWLLWNLRSSFRSDSAGRNPSAAHSQSTPSLF